SGGRLHSQIRKDLEKMILNDIAEGACPIVENSPALNAEIFSHRDLYAVDVIAIPERLQKRVREAKDQQVIHRSLSEVVIDAKDTCLIKSAEQNLVQCPCGFKVISERLLDDHAGPFGAARFCELSHHRSELNRRDRQIVRRPPAPAAQFLAERLERRRVL